MSRAEEHKKRSCRSYKNPRMASKDMVIHIPAFASSEKNKNKSHVKSLEDRFGPWETNPYNCERKGE